MKKQLFVILLILLSLLSAACGNKIQEELGDVRVETDSQGRHIKNTYLDDEGNVTRWEILSYDENGNLSKKEFYNPEDDEQPGYRGYTTYTYDARSNVIEEHTFDMDGVVAYKIFMEYYEDDKLHIKTEEEYFNGVLLSVTKKETAQADGEVIHEWEYVGENSEIIYESFSEDNGRIQKIIHYENGEIRDIQELVDNGDGTTKTTLNKNGDISEILTYDTETLKEIKRTLYCVEPAGMIDRVWEHDQEGFANKISVYEDNVVAYIQWETGEGVTEKVTLMSRDGKERTFEIREKGQSFSVWLAWEDVIEAHVELYSADGVLLEESCFTWEDGTLMWHKDHTG